ncbi:MAG TPA: hypothetical protein VG841_03085 [Caulobacterales bacterium]|nr:hypothetical protein [Caulobacterales bacterium]
MRAGILAFVAGLAVASLAFAADDPAPQPSPFPVQRGTAPPPPADTVSHAAPPEGVGAGGIDFGQWRSAAPREYEQGFARQIAQRLAGKGRAAVKADLEANGFACEDAARLDCRIEISERQCGFDWYVVLEQNAAAPVVGFEESCRAVDRPR